MKKPLTLTLSTLALGVIILGAGCNSSSQNPPLQGGSSTTASSSLDTMKTFTNKANEFSFSYPASFTAEEHVPEGERSGSSVVDLQSPWYIEEASAAGTGEMTKFYFGLSFEVRPLPLEDALTKASSEYIKAYRSLKNAENVDKKFVGTVSIDGREGYYFNSGAEGTNMRQIFVPTGKNASQTLVVSIRYVGDTLNNHMKPSAHSEKDQLDKAQSILDSLKFLN